ncbi:hypothetical protein [Segetibacter koreensis]|uniref:hypothetical protein n=1 Tax=Segetibacter koreensis TaxID=398037 RepID=UPI00035FE2E9|nr:hypothetical protein [Segetibacter koreensis]
MAKSRHGINVPCTAHGKMYKRYTFDKLATSLGTRAGVITEQKNIGNDIAT